MFWLGTDAVELNGLCTRLDWPPEKVNPEAVGAVKELFVPVLRLLLFPSKGGKDALVWVSCEPFVC